MAADGRESFERAGAWIAIDPDAETRDELTAIVDDARRTGDRAALDDRIGARLTFGTAGLRGEMGAGPNRINELIVRQTAAGLAAALRAHVPDARTRGVVVGHDARRNSQRFARLIVSVLEHELVPAWLVEGAQPTPLIAWGVRRLGVAAGVVVTASHNPARDNGIKIYWGDGAQIVPPVDHWIAEAIERVSGTCPEAAPHCPELETASLVDEYVAMVVGLVEMGADPAERGDLRIATTAMHGVGATLLRRCLIGAGFTALSEVASQAQPDPDFPTVPFPNPEEPGATDRLLELAASTGADLAIANDPDADRLAVGIRGPDGWRMLGGDELGGLLASGLMERRSRAPHPGRLPLLATTVVSSQLLSKIAAAWRSEYAETLTGFKWLCRPALADPLLDQVLAYEEAIGYAVGGLRDKDGISAAVAVADLFAHWKSRGVAVQDVLDDLALHHGAHVQHNFSVRLDGPGWAERLDAIAARVVADPPRALAGQPVERTDRPAPDVIRLFCANGDRAVIRPSGTEPKLKCYCEAVEPVAPDEHPDAARARAQVRLDAMADELTRSVVPTAG